MRRLLTLAILVGLAGAASSIYFYSQSRGNAPRYRLAKVERGSLTVAVSASGTINPVNTILVGSQVSGQIVALLADFNTPVRKGQVIARLSPEIFEAKVDQAKAELEAARTEVLTQGVRMEEGRADLDNALAALAEAKAQEAKARVAVLDAKRNLDRRNQLFRDGLIPKSEKETAEAAHDSAAAQAEAALARERAQGSQVQSARARLRVAETQLQNARAKVKNREASLRQAQADLDNTVITAPVDGVVVSRNVDVGQTVAASLQAPILFTIAQDLRQMQVNTLVDEADISQVRTEQRATFTVDSFPGQTFSGRVVQVRKAPQVVQNVVNYDVVISADNPDLKLLPGMTANVAIVVDRRQGVLKVPNGALRFNPTGGEAERARGGPPAQGAPEPGGGGRGMSLREMGPLIAQRLGLSAEQRAKLDDILREAGAEMRALRSRELPPAERGKEAQRVRGSVLEKVRGILTPGQQEPFAALAATLSGQDGGFPGRVWVVGREGQPEPLILRVGRSDGSFTEVLAGALREGQEVIVQAVAPARDASAGRGLRFGF